MTPDIAACLEKLETAIDLDWERHKIERWKRVLDFEPLDEPFRASRAMRPAEARDWPAVHVNEAIADPEKMLLQQLGMVYDVVRRRTWQIPNIRCNYGTGILPTLFGAEVFWMDDEIDTLPTTRPLAGEDAIDRLLDRGVPDLDAGFGGEVFATAEYFKEMLAPYPKIREVVWIYHPDLQGPIDVVELLWGSSMFYAFYDRPEMIKAVADLVTETYIRFLKRWFEIVPPRNSGAYMAHWGFLFRGQVMLRDDSIVNLSPEMYAEFVKPYDERILETFGGGAIHACGRIHHCIDKMTDSRHLTAVNISQPELNDLGKILAATVGKGVILNCPADERLLREFDVTRGVVLV